MITVNRNPTQRDLRIFGMLLTCFAFVVVALILWQFDSPRWAFRIGGVMSFLVMAYAAFPWIRRPVYFGWMIAAYPFGMLVSFLILLLLYYVLLTPIGWLRRIFVGDPLTRTWDTEARSYWSDRETSADPERYLRQY